MFDTVIVVEQSAQELWERELLTELRTSGKFPQGKEYFSSFPRWQWCCKGSLGKSVSLLWVLTGIFSKSS